MRLKEIADFTHVRLSYATVSCASKESDANLGVSQSWHFVFYVHLLFFPRDQVYFHGMELRVDWMFSA